MPINMKPTYNVGIVCHPSFRDYKGAEIIITKILNTIKDKYNFKIFFSYEENKIRNKDYPIGLLYAKKHFYNYEGILIDKEKYRGQAYSKAAAQVALQSHLLIIFTKTISRHYDDYRGDQEYLDYVGNAAYNAGKRHAVIYVIHIPSGKIETSRPKLPKPIEQM